MKKLVVSSCLNVCTHLGLTVNVWIVGVYLKRRIWSLNGTECEWHVLAKQDFKNVFYSPESYSFDSRRISEIAHWSDTVFWQRIFNTKFFCFIFDWSEHKLRRLGTTILLKWMTVSASRKCDGLLKDCILLYRLILTVEKRILWIKHTSCIGIGPMSKWSRVKNASSGQNPCVHKSCRNLMCAVHWKWLASTSHSVCISWVALSVYTWRVDVMVSL